MQNMALEPQSGQSPASPNLERVIRLDLDGTTLEIPDVLIQAIINDNVPDLLKPNAAKGAKERVMRLTMKAAMRLFLGYLEGQIIDKHLPMPLPQIPTTDDGEEGDVLEYGVFYILGLGIGLLSKSDLHATTEVTDDGVVRVTGLTATPTGLVEATDLGSLSRRLGAGKDAQSGLCPGDVPLSGDGSDAPTAG